MSSTFPIVKIDATVVKEILPIFINKGIFSNYEDLPERADLLKQYQEELGTEFLTKEQVRAYLSQIGEYRTNNYVVRDYGSYLIAFSLNAYQGNLNDDLQRVRLNKLGHKIAMIILSEVYNQRKWEELVISKQAIVEYLGYSTGDKYIYNDISDVMFSLRWLDYKIIEYKNTVSVKQRSKTTGNFIYNLMEDPKSYKLWVNPFFVGSVAYVLTQDKNSMPAGVLKSGYYSYPTTLLPLSRDYSQGAYLLTNFLMAEKGNSKLNTEEHKVVAYKISRLMEVMKLNYSRDDRNTQAFLDALEETQIIDQVDPDISTLKKLKTSRIQEQVVHLYVKKEIKQLDSEIKSNLLVTKMEKK